jgi:large conductance mechanosensitive channel
MRSLIGEGDSPGRTGEVRIVSETSYIENHKEDKMSMLKEFKEFAVKGNVVDMAVGIVIGVAFGKIISSLVSDVIMPPIGLIIGGIDFSKLSIFLKGMPGDPAAVVIAYGKFIQTIVDFTIVAFVIFMLIKAMNILKRKEEAAPPAPSKEETLLAEIRDILKEKR